jgi:hypothetical protein
MQQNFGRHLAGIAFRRRLARGKSRSGRAPLHRSASRRTVETAQLQLQRDCGLLGMAIRGHDDVSASGRRADDHRPTFASKPRPAPRKGGDDLKTLAVLGKRRRYLCDGKFDARYRPRRAADFADPQRI